MPNIKVVLYKENDEAVPLLDWFDEIPARARAKCLARIERLGKLGHELRRPEADYLRDGIHELRASLQGVHYRMLYFFHGRVAVVISHGMVKIREVPPAEIDRAIDRMQKYLSAPAKHTFEEG